MQEWVPKQGEPNIEAQRKQVWKECKQKHQGSKMKMTDGMEMAMQVR